jgi:hypothetical protein
MRSHAALFALSFAGIGLAPAPVEPPRSAPSVEPRAVRPPFFTSVRRAPVKVGALGGVFTPPYSDGAIDYEVELENPQATAVEGILVVERLGDGAPVVVSRTPVVAAPGGKTKVAFEDGLGLRDGCGPTRDRLRLEDVPTAPRVVRVTPSCTFAGETKADTEPKRRGKVLVTSAVLASSLACGAPLVVRATIKNEGRERAAGTLKMDGFATEVLRAFTVRGGAEQVVELTLPAFQGGTGVHALTLDVTGEGSQPSAWSLRTKRECTLDVAFDAN